MRKQIYELDFELNISRENALRYYQGRVKSVIVRANNGQRIQFPVQYIRPYINHMGIRGRFCIRFDDQHKFLDLRQID